MLSMLKVLLELMLLAPRNMRRLALNSRLIMYSELRKEVKKNKKNMMALLSNSHCQMKTFRLAKIVHNRSRQSRREGGAIDCINLWDDLM